MKRLSWDGRWRPLGAHHHYGRKVPVVGSVVAYDFRAWEVTHVRVNDFAEEDQERADHYTAGYLDRMRPYSVSLRRIHGAKHDRENSRQEIGLRVHAFAHWAFDVYEDGRVPLCSCHAQPWPCRDSVEQEQAESELKAAEKELRLLPGCCPACEEPVTSRQRSITFGGPNVRNPLAEGPTFHLRRKCHGSAASYEEAWVVAEPGRSRSLLTLTCDGSIVVHQDGSAECFGATNSDCPTVFARHRAYSACYLQSHGCGRQCSRQGHPGTHITGYPSDPRAVTRVES